MAESPDVRGIIAAIRDGRTPSDAALSWFAVGLASGEVSDAQAGAFAMAVCLRGLSEAGRVALTEAMRDSGTVLDWDLPGPVLDKHSTGGIGRLRVASAGAGAGGLRGLCPMISGRGLGHTGGTLDKLEAIPGYVGGRWIPRAARRSRRGSGCAIVAASAISRPPTGGSMRCAT
jgi:thymidine phosphorylase